MLERRGGGRCVCWTPRPPDHLGNALPKPSCRFEQSLPLAFLPCIRLQPALSFHLWFHARAGSERGRGDHLGTGMRGIPRTERYAPDAFRDTRTPQVSRYWLLVCNTGELSDIGGNRPRRTDSWQQQGRWR